MTGRELIMYILKNGLEDEDIFKDDVFIGFMTVEQAAAKFDVGIHTVLFWYNQEIIKGFDCGGVLYFKADLEDPRKLIRRMEDI